MDDEQAPGWYCVRTATRRESHVMTALYELRQDKSLIAQFYLPVETRWGPYLRDGKTRLPKDCPLLVGYLFVRMFPQDLWHLEDVYGVHRILDHAREDGRRIPTQIPDRFIDKLREAQEAGKFDRTQGKSRAKGAERIAWKKLADLAAMTEDERLRALAGYLGLKVEPEPEPEIDYSAVMDERRAA